MQPELIYKVTVPAPIYERANVTAAVVEMLPAGHSFRTISYSSEWVKLEAQLGPKFVTGYVEIPYTNFGG